MSWEWLSSVPLEGLYVALKMSWAWLCTLIMFLLMDVYLFVTTEGGIHLAQELVTKAQSARASVRVLDLSIPPMNKLLDPPTPLLVCAIPFHWLFVHGSWIRSCLKQDVTRCGRAVAAHKEREKRRSRENMRVFKYELELKSGALQTVEMAENERILHVQAQGQIPCFWAEHPTAGVVVSRKFVLIETGQDCFWIREAEGKETYLGTMHFDGGSYVLHLYELPARVCP